MTTDSTISLDEIDAGLADVEPKLTPSEQRLAVASTASSPPENP